MGEVHWTEVNGVTTVWTQAPEPLRAGLMFRTGRADETLVTTGRTHLIEHAILSLINNRFANGGVDDLTTGFVTIGSPDDVSAFFSRVCEILQSLPADRLEAEKKVLPAEAAGRPFDLHGDLLMWRFGAAGHGLRALQELGIRNATPEQLQEWSAQRLTRGNAILWLSGPPPANLRLELPPGEKQPLPPLRSLLPKLPAWFGNDRYGGIAVGGIVPRVAASSVFSMIAATRLHNELRIGRSVSYSPWISYEPLNADSAHLVLHADSAPDRRPELSDAFGETFEKLAEFDDAEVDAARKLYRETTTGSLAPPLSDRLVTEVQRAALDWLLGREFESMECIAEEAQSVSTADVAAFASELQQTSIFAVPGGAIIRPWMGTKAPKSIGPAVKGREAPGVDAPIQRARLVYGPDGVSLKWPDDSHLTVRYSELAAALHYEDGCMFLVGSDATALNIEPTLWRNGASICREIYAQIPDQLIVEQGIRPANEIPKPKTTAWQRLWATVNVKIT